MITNFRSTEHNVKRIFDRLTVIGKPVSSHPRAPREILGRYYLIEKRFFAKTGELVECLHLPGNFSMTFLKDIYPNHRVADSKVPSPFLSFGEGIKLRPEFDYRSEKQQWIVSYLNRYNSFEAIPDTGLDLITAETSVGKSYSFIRSWIERGAPKLLACFAKIDHLENFKAELLKFTTLDAKDIKVIAGQKNIDEPTDAKVTLIIARTYSNAFRDQITLSEPDKPHYTSTYPIVEATPKIISFIKKSQIGELLIDEVHLELHAHAYLIMQLNLNKITCLTATAARTIPKETEIFKLIMPAQFLALEKEKRIDVRPIFYDSGFPDKLLPLAYSQHGFMNTLYHDLMLSDFPSYKKFLDALVKIIREIKADDAKSIGVVLPSTLPFLARVESDLRQIFTPDGFEVGQFSSVIKNKKERLKALDMDICVTTEKSFNGSINPTNMNYMILHGAIQSPVTVEQISGRLRGLDGNSCVFIDLIDELVAPCKDAWLARRTVFNKIAKSVAAPVHI